MVAPLTPLAIVLGLVATLGLLFFTVWERVAERVETAAVGFVNGFGTDIERANISAARERVATVIIITTVVLWLIGVILVRGNPIQAILILPVAFAIVAFGFQRYLRGRAAKRLKKFGDQLELVENHPAPTIADDDTRLLSYHHAVHGSAEGYYVALLTAVRDGADGFE